MNFRTLLRVKINEKVKRVKNEVNVATANEITKVLLTLIFFIKMKKINDKFSLLFTLHENVNNL